MKHLKIALVEATTDSTHVYSRAYAKDYSLSLDVKKIAPRKISITVNSNLPDSTNLLITVGRIHYIKEEQGEYSGEIYSKDIALKQGKLETTVNINDAKWYNEHQQLVNAAPENFFPISKILDSIDIEVLFSPGRDQPKEILDILGKSGENIKGTYAESEFGMVTMFISKTIEIPFKR
jgi:Icc-related predicted phosphoesterase